MKKLFIVGCGRSGTTMLQQALNRHSRIIIPPETGYFVDVLTHTRIGQAQHLRKLGHDLEIDLPIPARRIRLDRDAIDAYESLASAYAQKLGRTDVIYFGDKSPRHLLVLPRIVRLFPDAKILLIYRDGRDVALSLTKVPWGPKDLYVNFAIWLRFYRRHRWALSQPDLDLCCIKYEDFVRDPEQALRRIVTHLGLTFEAPMVSDAGNVEGIAERELGWKARATEPITPRRIGLWRTELTVTQQRQLERWGREPLSTLGYELATGGTHPLPPWFFPLLVTRHTTWRARCAARLLTKNLLGT